MPAPAAGVKRTRFSLGLGPDANMRWRRPIQSAHRLKPTLIRAKSRPAWKPTPAPAAVQTRRIPSRHRKSRSRRVTSGYDRGEVQFASSLVPICGTHGPDLAGGTLQTNRFCRTFLSGRYWARTSDLLLVRLGPHAPWRVRGSPDCRLTLGRQVRSHSGRLNAERRQRCIPSLVGTQMWYPCPRTRRLQVVPRRCFWLCYSVI